MFHILKAENTWIPWLPLVCLLQGQCPALPSASTKNNQGKGEQNCQWEGEYFPEDLD